MLQEVITYMIIGSAVTIAALKMAKKLGIKKKKPKAQAQKGPVNPASIHAHNCGECSADCQLRDLPKYIIQKNIDECVQVEQKSKLLQS
ncbi:hypothetical protein INQ51_11835 [Maribellus sp. CM-23]|uniref:hypothetical protein n=1 Tax=Maribellus sp. CM-23 TaxID=2781026 RepID=UPI001F1D2139|nr:hypothetical protein [Maribellus sp. CM-23]MCE4565002.1 hypothetical protein [Maribellus sp. CM-23]